MYATAERSVFSFGGLRTIAGKQYFNLNAHQTHTYAFLYLSLSLSVAFAPLRNSIVLTGDNRRRLCRSMIMFFSHVNFQTFELLTHENRFFRQNSVYSVFFSDWSAIKCGLFLCATIERWILFFRWNGIMYIVFGWIEQLWSLGQTLVCVRECKRARSKLLFW